MRCPSLIFRLLSIALVLSFLPAFALPFVFAREEEKINEKKYVALTFDDGPHPRQTEKILDLLDSYNIKATFFVIGLNLEQWGDIVAREIRSGHEVGNHTFSHKHLISEKPEELRSDLQKTDSMLKNKYSYKTRLFRPPEGYISDSVRSISEEFGYTTVLWNVDTRDWANTETEKIVSTVIRHVKSGDIILFHDYVVGESHTYEALLTLIPWLCNEGYSFATVSELYGL